MQCLWWEWNIGIPLQSKNENWPSSRDDLGYTELPRVVAVTSGFFSTCDGVPADSLEYNKGSQASFLVGCGARICSGNNAGESGLIAC